MIEKPTIIIGGSIESLLYAWRTQTTIIIKKPHYVYRHDHKFNDYDLSFISAENPKQLQKNLLFALSFSGLAPYSGRITNIRRDKNILHVYTEGNKKIRLRSDNIIRFDRIVPQQFDVYDFFDMREAQGHKIKELMDEDDFIYQLNFFNSPRTDSPLLHDVVGASKMTQKQILDPDYGQGIAMLKMKRMLKSAGLKGPFAWERKGKRYYKQIKMDFYKREVWEVLETKHTFKEIYNMKQLEGEEWKKLEMLRKPGETSLG